MEQKEQTAVEFAVAKLEKFIPKGNQIAIDAILNQAKEIEKHQQDTFAIDFAEWYEEDVLAKGDYEMIAKDKKELLEIFKETYGKQ